jgi:tRNA uridine 5-carboxymethylaminomethyl modification enzyme
MKKLLNKNSKNRGKRRVFRSLGFSRFNRATERANARVTRTKKVVESGALFWDKISMSSIFDAIVIGGGHAGIEAARALVAMGQKIALVTMDPNKLGAMSCNPAIGGVAKSHLVSEVDALGGLMGYVADCAGVQSRRLNINKGPAVRSTRIQCDKDRYVRTMIAELRTLRLDIVQAEVTSLGVRAGTWTVRLSGDSELTSRAVIITTGTFMRGLMFCGEGRSEGGRVGDSAAKFLSESLVGLGHNLTRLKTGTPARLRAETIDFQNLEKQWGDPELRRFSWRKPKDKLPQICCYITHTNERTHEIIRANFHKSPLFSGDIVGLGPRYCPSIEDKVKRFSERNRHQIFLEPEGVDTNSIYPNGMSTSLPADVQLEFFRSIQGLEHVELLRPGYAVEYDTINPTDLHPSFMSKFSSGLYFAGQVNRTSGYEEAAAQGLWAGMNAGLLLQGKDQLKPERSRSYLETLADDLTGVGTSEPYRMFTSRSEYRLVLREDNAQERLLELGRELGLISDEQLVSHETLLAEIESGRSHLENKRIRVSKDTRINLMEYLKRPEVTWETLNEEDAHDISDRAIESLEIEAKYEGYLGRQERELKALARLKTWSIDHTCKLEDFPSLSKEVIEKFNYHKPKSVLELSRISGMPPTAVLLIAKIAGRPGQCFT